MLLPTVLIVVVGLVVGDNKILVFPTASKENYISFRPGLPTMKAYTVCAWQMDRSGDGQWKYWFSYNVQHNENQILLGDGSSGVRLYMMSSLIFPVGSLPYG